jgi:hypothetical protein
MVQFEFVWGQVGKARVRPNCIEMPTPRFDDDLGLAAGAEPLDAETLIAKLSVERRNLVARVRPPYKSAAAS